MNNLGLRLQQARKAAGYSLRGLADLVDLSHAAIKKYEDGIVYPTSDLLIKLSRALRVRVDFFFRPIKVVLKDLKFRKRKKLKRQVEEAIRFDVIDQIERRLELENLYPTSPTSTFVLPSGLPQKISSLDEIEAVAEKLRTHWKLGLAPIHDLTDALENLGVRVFIVDLDEDHFDGFSTTVQGQPVIVISAKWSGDRQRFDLAHELGHYIFMGRLSSSLDEEQVCNRFAGAFLFPKKAVLQAIGNQRRAIEWQELLLTKEQFQMSMSAICYRLKDLKVIPESYYKSMMIRFRQKGWHRKEPGLVIPPEKAHTFNQMVFHALGEEYIGESKAAELMACSLSQLKALRQVHASTHQ
jgi:Zn-dependent peptidase ImmA (M78 family)/DNA-binding XRE family transcriptional regulator